MPTVTTNQTVDAAIMFGSMTGSCWDAICRALPPDDCLPLTALHATNRYIARQDINGCLLGLPPSQLHQTDDEMHYDRDDTAASSSPTTTTVSSSPSDEPTPSMLVHLFDEAQSRGVRCCFPVRYQDVSSPNDRQQQSTSSSSSVPKNSKPSVSASCLVFRPITTWSQTTVLPYGSNSSSQSILHQQHHEAVAITLIEEDVVSVAMISKLVASIVPAPKKTTTSTPYIPPPPPRVQKHIVALKVNTCDTTRTQALLVLIKAAISTPTLLSRLTVIDFEGMRTANGSVAWGAAKAAGQSLRRLRVIGDDSSTSRNLEEVRRLCTRLEDVEILISADFAMLSFARLVESCGQTLRRVALCRGGRTVSSHALQNALAHHCTQLRDIETIEFVFAYGEGSGTVEKLFRNNPNLHSVQINYKKEWVPLLKMGVLFPLPPPTPSNNPHQGIDVNASSSPSPTGHALLVARRTAVGGGGGGVDGLRSITMCEARADLQRTGSSSDDSSDDDDTTSATEFETVATTASVRRLYQPRAITLLSPCFQTGNLTSLNLEVGHLYHILPFPELLFCSPPSPITTNTSNGGGWNPFINIVNFRLVIRQTYMDVDELNRWEKKRLRAHTRTWTEKYGLPGGGERKNPPDWASPPLPSLTGSDDDGTSDDRHEEEEPSRRTPPPSAARKELAALIFAISPSVKKLALHNCIYEEVMDSGIPYCCRLEELFLVEMVRVGSAAVSDECIGRLLTSIGNSNNGISAYSPLRSLKIVGFAALGDLTLKALTHANLPFLSSVTLLQAIQ